MHIKLVLWLALISLALAYCNSTCASCASPYSNYVSNTCYSCIDKYFLYASRCYSCAYCSSYNSCSSCTSSDSSNSSLSIFALVGIIFGIIGGLFIFIIVFRCIRAICCNSQSVNNAPEAPGSAINLVHQPSLSRVQFKHNWTHDSIKFQFSQNCAICLDSNVFLHTHCHHYFHAKCIWEWSAKKQSNCPICKCQVIFPARIFCQSCYQQSYEVDSRTLAVVIGQGKWKVCNNCKQI